MAAFPMKQLLCAIILNIFMHLKEEHSIEFPKIIINPDILKTGRIRSKIT